MKRGQAHHNACITTMHASGSSVQRGQAHHNACITIMHASGSSVQGHLEPHWSNWRARCKTSGQKTLEFLHILV
eukprot:1137218-Pelagomonas_calceolata.AAC.1